VRSSRFDPAARPCSFELKFYCDCRSSPVLDLCMTQAAGLATHPAPSRRLTADPEATAVAGLRQATLGWADLLAECAGLALGYGEHQCDAPGTGRSLNCASPPGWTGRSLRPGSRSGASGPALQPRSPTRPASWQSKRCHRV
jgi:hypothetical protein